MRVKKRGGEQGEDGGVDTNQTKTLTFEKPQSVQTHPIGLTPLLPQFAGVAAILVKALEMKHDSQLTALTYKESHSCELKH